MAGGVPSDVPIVIVLAFLAGMVALLLMLIFTTIIMSYCTQRGTPWLRRVNSNRRTCCAKIKEHGFFQGGGGGTPREDRSPVRAVACCNGSCYQSRTKGEIGLVAIEQDGARRRQGRRGRGGGGGRRRRSRASSYATGSYVGSAGSNPRPHCTLQTALRMLLIQAARAVRGWRAPAASTG